MEKAHERKTEEFKPDKLRETNRMFFFVTLFFLFFQNAIGFPADVSGSEIRNPSSFEQTDEFLREGRDENLTEGRSDDSKQEDQGKGEKKTSSNDSKKQWNLSWTSTYSRGVHWLAKSRWSNDLGVSYKFPKISLLVRGAYIYPLSKVTETSFYGLTDMSLSGRRSLKDLTGLNIMGGLGVSLPTSERARKQDKYSSFYGSLSYKYSRPQFSKLLGPLSLNHVFYWGWYGSRSDKSGFPIQSSSFYLSQCVCGCCL